MAAHHPAPINSSIKNSFLKNHSLAPADSVPGRTQATTALQGASPDHPQPKKWRQKAEGEQGYQWKWKCLCVSGLSTVQTRNLVITHVLCSLKASSLCLARWLSLAMLGCDKWHFFSSYSPPLVQHVSSSVGSDPQKHRPSTAGPSCDARTSCWQNTGQQAGPRASPCPAHGLCHPLLEPPEPRGEGRERGEFLPRLCIWICPAIAATLNQWVLLSARIGLCSVGIY